MDASVSVRVAMTASSASQQISHRAMTMQDDTAGNWIAVCSCGWDGDYLSDRYDADMQGVLHASAANGDLGRE